MGTNCCQYFVVEHNGDIYPCDFFVERHLKVGNITTDSWEALSASKTYREFGAQKAMWNSLCNECEFLEFCAADCLKHRLPAHGSPETLSPLCNGWKQFFRHALPGFRRLAREIIEDRRRIAAARQQQLAHQTKPKQRIRRSRSSRPSEETTRARAAAARNTRNAAALKAKVERQIGLVGQVGRVGKIAHALLCVPCSLNAMKPPALRREPPAMQGAS